MESKNVIKYIKICVLAVIFIGIYIFIAIKVGDKDKVNSDNFLIIGDALIWHEKNGKWYQETEYSEEFGQHKFVGYNDMNEFKATSAQYSNSQWYFFDDSYNQVNNSKFRFAYSGSIKVKPINYVISEYGTSDDVILDNNIKYQNDEEKSRLKRALTKYLYDFDNDGKLEAIYITSSASLVVENFEPRSYVFYVKDGKVLDKKSDTTNLYGITEILDINEDNQYEIVMDRGILNNPTLDACYQIYMVKDNKLNLVQNCLYNK